MVIENYLLNDKDKPEWLNYPEALKNMILNGEVKLTPWHLMQKERVLLEISVLFKLYQRHLIPFAYRQDNDNLACFEKESSKVFIIHVFASKGFENEDTFENFDDWYQDVYEEMVDW